VTGDDGKLTNLQLFEEENVVPALSSFGQVVISRDDQQRIEVIFP
jgi:hypothetical protein